jgi:N utilization substance protein B
VGTPRPLPVSRSESRERALHLLDEAESRDLPPAGALTGAVVTPDPYARRLVEGVEEHLGAIDELIGRLSRGWTLERMPAMDRAVLRIGVYELGHEPEVPTAVVLDEAVELAKRYSTEESGRFVNGVLAAAAAELRPPPGD